MPGGATGRVFGPTEIFTVDAWANGLKFLECHWHWLCSRNEIGMTNALPQHFAQQQQQQSTATVI
jgi:frataxin-like iron-binding protein CyaY